MGVHKRTVSCPTEDRLQGAYTNFIWYEGNATENIADANEASGEECEEIG